MFEASELQDDPGLTSRERQILELIAYGLSAKEMALRIGIAPRTVDRHIENLRHKMRARNKSHLVAKAIAFGNLECDRPPANSNLMLGFRARGS